MTATIEIFRRLYVHSGDSTLIDWGSIITPQQPTGTACEGEPSTKRTITIAPGDTATLWEWANDGDFAVMLIECDGFCWIAQKLDAPTSDTDNTPSGSKICHPKEGLSCIGPMLIQGMIAPVLADDNDYQDFPFDSSVANGRRYAVYAKNPASASASVTLTFIWTK